MTYRDLKRKYMLHEITKEEYELGKERLIRILFDAYEEHIIDEKTFKDKINILKD